jgi:hypothetical protein
LLKHNKKQHSSCLKTRFKQEPNTKRQTLPHNIRNNKQYIKLTKTALNTKDIIQNKF